VDCPQVERLEVENLRAVGLRNKMAAMHEVSTGLSSQKKPHNLLNRRRVTQARTCWRPHSSCVLASQERRRMQQELQQQLKEKQQELDR
jgi:hypothetical protein